MSFYFMLSLLIFTTIFWGLVTFFLLKSSKPNHRSILFFITIIILLYTLPKFMSQCIDGCSENGLDMKLLWGYITGFLVVASTFFVRTKRNMFLLWLTIIIGYIIALNGFEIAEVFFESSINIPLTLRVWPVIQIILRQLPLGLLIVAPFFLTKNPKKAFSALGGAQIVFILTTVYSYYWYLPRYDEPVIGTLAFINALPIGGLLFLGLYGLYKTMKTHSVIQMHHGILIISAVFFCFQAYSITSMILENHETEESFISGYEIHPITGDQIPIIYANPCEKTFDIERCMED